ncbi:MAG: hypothetical protein Q8M29_01955 [Bacteroidota bacterium]|nr:hypothetical protein [Bacteroidota bacterium]
MALVKKIVFYTLLIVILSWLLEYAVLNGIRKNKIGLYNKFNRIFHQQNNYDLLIIGSSRAEGHFNTKIIDSIVGCNSFNIGISGSNNAFTYGIYKTYLSKSKAPKIVVMNIDFHFSHHSSDTIYEFPRYFPYLDNEILYNELKQRDPRFYLFKYMPLYKLAFMGDKYLNIAARGYTGKPGIYDWDCYKGFQAINPIQFKDISKEDTSTYKGIILKENIDYLDSIISISKKNSTKVYIVVSPTYIKGSKRIVNLEEHMKGFEKVAKEREIPFMDYTKDSICYKGNLFADFYHMKKEGAVRFSSKFANDFKKLLSKE